MTTWEQVRSEGPWTPYGDIEGDYRRRTCEQGAAENLVGPRSNHSQAGSIEWMCFGTQNRRSRETVTRQVNKYRLRQFEDTGPGRKGGSGQLCSRPTTQYVRYHTNAKIESTTDLPSRYCPLTAGAIR